VKFDGLSTTLAQDQIFMRMQHLSSPWHSWEMRMNAASTPPNRLLLRVLNAAGVNSNVFSDNVLVTGRWYHWALTINSSFNVTLYLDGVAQSTTPTLAGFFNADGALRIGGNNGSDVNLMGGMDDVRFYNRVLSLFELQQLYAMGAPVGQSTALPQGCPDIGDVCDDGTVYAGLSPDGNVPMFVAPADSPTTLPWNNGNSSGYVQTNLTGDITGQDYTNNLVALDSDSVTGGFQAHRAAQYCFDLVAAGADDWYLPGRDELELVTPLALRINLVVGLNYLSSRESTIDRASRVRYNSELDPVSGGWISKNTSAGVRCVRKGPAPRCANPYGVEGQMIYNSTHDLVQYCDGARWIAVGKSGL
jgi:hypothetical protein